MSAYAAGTSVEVGRTQVEIERTLARYGARAFARGWDGSRAVIQFEMAGRLIRFDVGIPERKGFEVTDKGRRRQQAAIDVAMAQAQRQRWRALLLVIKAKLEAIRCGISTAEDEFLSWTVLPSGQTVGRWLHPQLEQAQKSGHMPKLLALPGGAAS